mgnify:CR=1 FL=1
MRNKIKNMSVVILGLLLINIPVITFAQSPFRNNPLIMQPNGSGAPKNFAGVVQMFLEILDQVVLLIIGLALVAFLWGVIKYMRGGDVEKVKEAREFIVWGIIGLFVMISVWGLVAVLTNTFF